MRFSDNTNEGHLLLFYNSDNGTSRVTKRDPSNEFIKARTVDRKPSVYVTEP